MHLSHEESHGVSVLAGQGRHADLARAVKRLAEREQTTTDEILIACKDDYHQTAAHIAAKAGQVGSIEALASLFASPEKLVVFFNMANRFSGDRPVHTAMRHGYLSVFKALVSYGADPTVPNRFGDKVVDYEGDYEPHEVQDIVDSYVKKATEQQKQQQT